MSIVMTVRGFFMPRAAGQACESKQCGQADQEVATSHGAPGQARRMSALRLCSDIAMSTKTRLCSSADLDLLLRPRSPHPVADHIAHPAAHTPPLGRGKVRQAADKIDRPERLLVNEERAKQRHHAAADQYDAP